MYAHENVLGALIPTTIFLRDVIWSFLHQQFQTRPLWRSFRMRWVQSWIGICLESSWGWKITNSVQLSKTTVETVASLRCWVVGFEVPNFRLHGKRSLMPFSKWESKQLPRRYEQSIAVPPLRVLTLLVCSHLCVVSLLGITENIVRSPKERNQEVESKLLKFKDQETLFVNCSYNISVTFVKKYRDFWFYIRVIYEHTFNRYPCEWSSYFDLYHGK